MAYVALFFALCGSGLAATNEVAHLTSGAKVKVRCSATNGRKRIAGTSGTRPPPVERRAEFGQHAAIVAAAMRKRAA